MPKKLTVEFINSQIASRGIVMIGEYLNKGKHSLFLCDCGNKWSSRVAHVMGGSGCPTCTFQNLKLKKEDINELLSPRGIVMTGDYLRYGDKTDFECESGHTWSTTPAIVLSGKKRMSLLFPKRIQQK